jgi:hypothetical protein
MGNPLARIGFRQGGYTYNKLGGRIKRAVEKVKR